MRLVDDGDPQVATDTPVTDTAPVDTAATPKIDPDYQAYLDWKAGQAAAKEAKRIADAPAEYYVWLCNGDVVRVKVTDFPVSLTADKGGHFEKDGNVYDVAFVFPVEVKVGK